MSFINKVTNFGNATHILNKLFCKTLTNGTNEIDIINIVDTNYVQNYVRDNLTYKADKETPILVWQSGKSYIRDNIVIHDSKIYQCNTDNEDTVFDKNKWTNIGGGDSLWVYDSNENIIPKTVEELIDGDNTDISTEDLPASNITSSNQIQSHHNNYITIWSDQVGQTTQTKFITKNYTAPVDGWIFAKLERISFSSSTTIEYLEISISCFPKINNNILYVKPDILSNTGVSLYTYLPVMKGEVVIIQADNYSPGGLASGDANVVAYFVYSQNN